MENLLCVLRDALDAQLDLRKGGSGNSIEHQTNQRRVGTASRRKGRKGTMVL